MFIFVYQSPMSSPTSTSSLPLFFFIISSFPLFLSFLSSSFHVNYSFLFFLFSLFLHHHLFSFLFSTSFLIFPTFPAFPLFTRVHSCNSANHSNSLTIFSLLQRHSKTFKLLFLVCTSQIHFLHGFTYSATLSPVFTFLFYLPVLPE